jgi:hypothetical protein
MSRNIIFELSKGHSENKRKIEENANKERIIKDEKQTPVVNTGKKKRGCTERKKGKRERLY